MSKTSPEVQNLPRETIFAIRGRDASIYRTAETSPEHAREPTVSSRCTYKNENPRCTTPSSSIAPVFPSIL